MFILSKAQQITEYSSGKARIALQFKDENGIIPDHVFEVTEDDPRYETVLEILSEPEPDSEELLYMVDNSHAVQLMADVLASLRDTGLKIDVSAHSVTYRGEEVAPEIVNHIMYMVKSPNPNKVERVTALANFVEKLYNNQSDNVREQLYSWITYMQSFEQGFTITKDGCLLGYKGVRRDEDGDTYSINTGSATVNGEKYLGNIPNPVGAVVTMPIEEVEDNPAVGCSTGLHVGTYGYASRFAMGAILLVKVDPADIVSVPYECDAQKMRTCRYEVLEVIEVPYNDAVYDDEEEDHDNEEEYDEEYDDEEYDDEYDEEEDEGEDED